MQHWLVLLLLVAEVEAGPWIDAVICTVVLGPAILPAHCVAAPAAAAAAAVAAAVAVAGGTADALAEADRVFHSAPAAAADSAVTVLQSNHLLAAEPKAEIVPAQTVGASLSFVMHPAKREVAK